MNKIISFLYDFDKNDNSYIIKLSPDSYHDVFNSLDHYPLKRRDIKKEVIDYIEECSKDIPLKEKIKIEISIKNGIRSEDMEERTIKGISNNILYILDYYKRQSMNVVRMSLLYGLIFLVLVFTTFFVESLEISINKLFFKTIFEGLSIGSWVFLWEAIAGITIKNSRNIYLIMIYRRLLHSEFYFLYS